MVDLFAGGSSVRGTITAVQPGQFTIRTDEGDLYKVLYGPNTRIIKNRQPVDSSEVHSGDMLMAAGELDKKARTLGAAFLFDLDAAEVERARAGFGKTWIAGKITAIHGLNVIISRADNQASQTLAVDENTSFRKQGQDVTLLDLKVGDFINSQGELRNNLFVVRVLRVMESNRPDSAQQPAGPSPGSNAGRSSSPGPSKDR